MSLWRVEQLTPGVCREWFDHGQIAVYRVLDGSNETVNAYIDAALAQLKIARPNRPLLMIHDLTGENLAFTPYFRRRGEEIAEYMETHPVSSVSAVILPKSVIARPIQNYSEQFTQRAKRANQRNFDSFEEGLAWVRTYLTKV
ncbi:MAG: hypothetical protein MUF87_13620 [Anaerolineae bacterium]|jgi:hypothetical protein|nr:hypothetical protein [Anaerolineae bacterium]